MFRTYDHAAQMAGLKGGLKVKAMLAAEKALRAHESLCGHPRREGWICLECGLDTWPARRLQLLEEYGCRSVAP